MKRKKRMMIKLIIIAVGLASLIWFMAPLVAHVFNIGNGLGMAYSVCLIFMGIFLDQILLLIKHDRAVSIPALSLLSLGLVVVLVLTSAMTFYGIKPRNYSAGESYSIVVLGCSVKGEKPSLMLKKRLEAALEVYHERENEGETVLVLSGGQGKGENISEAQCMYNYLSEKGLAPDCLYLEERSTRTVENIEYSMEIIEENSLPQKIILVSNDFHMFRSKKIAETVTGQTVATAPGVTPKWLLPTFYVRELISIIYFFIFD